MKEFEVSVENMDIILNQIRNDIFQMEKQIISSDNIKISMPYYFRRFIEYVSRQNGITDGKTLYGKEILNGYNNQICVFDEMADPREKSYCEPILLKL